MLNYVYQFTGLFGSSQQRVNEVQTGCTIQRLLLHYPAAGYRSSSTGAFIYVSSRGYYRSTATGTANAYYLSFLSTGEVYPSNASDRSFGLSVRCVSVF